MAFGAGVLISALSFELMDEAYKRGGFDSTAIGFLGGAAVYTAANWFLSQQGAKHRKRSGALHPAKTESGDGGLAIALGALLDGIPESIVVGVSMISGGAVSWVTVAAIFLSNIPEGLSSAAGMKKAGRSIGYIFGVWGAIAVISGISALLGYTLFSHFSAESNSRNYRRSSRGYFSNDLRYYDSRSIRGNSRFCWTNYCLRVFSCFCTQQVRGKIIGN